MQWALTLTREQAHIEERERERERERISAPYIDKEPLTSLHRGERHYLDSLGNVSSMRSLGKLGRSCEVWPIWGASPLST